MTTANITFEKADGSPALAAPPQRGRSADLGELMGDGKKRREKWIVEALLSKVDPTLLSRLRPSEGPDFLIVDSMPKLGIEVRELYWGSDTSGRPLQASEGAADKIAAKAARLWDQRGLPPLCVSITWQPSLAPKAPRADQIAQQLVATIEANRCKPDGVPTELHQSGLPGDPLPDEVCSVIIFRSSGLSRSYWDSSRAGYFGQCTPDAIVAALKDKEPHLAKYRTQADRIWLVLGIAGIEPSSFIEVPKSTVDCNYRSGFDRVFLVEAFDKRVHELSLGRGAKSDRTPNNRSQPPEPGDPRLIRTFGGPMTRARSQCQAGEGNGAVT